MQYSNNGDLDQLIEQITDVIVARLNGANDQPAMCGGMVTGDVILSLVLIVAGIILTLRR